MMVPVAVAFALSFLAVLSMKSMTPKWPLLRRGRIEYADIQILMLTVVVVVVVGASLVVIYKRVRR